jgi:S-DNA-T family DNA segregation ATPase FtsK/SpoIIIE
MATSARASKLAVAGSELPRRREVLGLLLLGLALFLGLSVFSFQLGNRSMTGPFGRLCAVGVYGLCGVTGYLVVAAVARSAWRVLLGRRAMVSKWEWAGLCVGLPGLSILFYLIAGAQRLDGFGPGGLIGEYGGAVLRAAIGTAGAALTASIALLLGLLGATPLRAVVLLTFVRHGARVAWGGMKQGARSSATLASRAAVTLFPGPSDDDDPDDGDDESESENEPPARASKESAADTGVTVGKDKVILLEPRMRKKTAPPPRPDDGEGAPTEEASPSDTVRMDSPPSFDELVPPKRKGRSKSQPAPAVTPSVEPAASMPSPIAPEPVAEPAPEPDAALPVIVESGFAKKAAPKARAGEFIMAGSGGFHLPAVDLLDYSEGSRSQLDRSVMHEIAARLQSTLQTYGVHGKVTEIHPGPVVTMYEFVPELGTRIAKIAGLADELAMTLEALRVRIVAPIPGKNAVGIEVPNPVRETVFLKEILADDVFSRARSKLTMALGKDIAGRPVVVDLAKMPHLLVAGTTGSGKSVSVNSMICSLLYGASPEEVRLIMVDPKMLELSVYEGVPHLLLPVVTDPKKANLALRWAVEEMERRYELLATAGVRDLAGYNKKVEKLASEAPATPEPPPAPNAAESATPDAASSGVALADTTGPTQLPLPRSGRLPDGAKKLPYIVIIIDEFADLMMVASKEVETSVARIAQKARAAGIHLLLATQRPSVDVITGLIKANFPSRIAFQVSSKVDSRTILDQGGAEALLGQGDMLFSDRGGALRRVHGCLVTDTEIGRIVDFLKQQGTPVYDMDILKPRDEEEGDKPPGEEDFDDAMYDQAIRVVAETRQASISMLQRRLRVGYNRAARMIEKMEREGIVGPADGPNRREVLISSQ